MHEQPLEDVLVSPYMRTPERAGLVEMRTRPFEEFPTFSEQAFRAGAADAPSIRVNRVAFRLLSIHDWIPRSGSLM